MTDSPGCILDLHWVSIRSSLGFCCELRHCGSQTKTPNGNKVFWSRGNGWAFAAMARTLEALPASRTADRKEYASKLITMAARLKTLQGKDGCWRPSLEDPEEFPAIETTGTSLFVVRFLLLALSLILHAHSGELILGHDLGHRSSGWRGA